MENKWTGLIIYLVILSNLNVTRGYKEYDGDKVIDEQPKVQVRSVFVNCKNDAFTNTPDSDAIRFEQHELFKHNALKNCVKKMAVTVKITSETDRRYGQSIAVQTLHFFVKMLFVFLLGAAKIIIIDGHSPLYSHRCQKYLNNILSSGDEYLPIEHVFEGPSQRRVRLLDPYILRLRRDMPLQAYKLRKLEIVSGIVMDPLDRKKIKRDLGLHSDAMSAKMFEETHQLQVPSLYTTETVKDLKDCEKNNNCKNHNRISERYKRKDRNLVVEQEMDDNTKWISKGYSHRDINKYNIDLVSDEKLLDRGYKLLKSRNKKESLENEPYLKNSQRQFKPVGRNTMPSIDGKVKEHVEFEEPLAAASTSRSAGCKNSENVKSKYKYNNRDYSDEKTYEIYNIGPPQIWYNVHVQLFEKMSTPDGKTVWNDLTKGDVASVSSIVPEWAGQNLHVRYRSTEHIPRKEFTLPSNRLCLLISSDTYPNINNGSSQDAFGNVEYIVIPEEDIVDLKENVKKRYDNSSESDMEPAFNNSDAIVQKYRKVAIRLSRSVLRKNEDNPNVASQGKDRYLTLRHQRPHSVQIDLEVRADENELVHVGSSGRISIAVADSTRRTRTILNLQVGNTGLAAANYRVAVKDFDPLLSDLVKDKGAVMAGPILIPPRHTRSVHLELPGELPVDVAHCSVALLNDQDQSVAIRNVDIKKGDRCFCVWHCECVCLSDDPRLICHDMDEAGMTAAGLTAKDRPRYTRSICCLNVGSLNSFVIFIGVVVTLLFFGLIKAVLGLACHNIGAAGLRQLLQTPRHLDKYYERSLQNREVEYDEENWPIHPDTRTRSVRFVSVPMEFLLNTIFFVSVPCILLYEGIKSLLTPINDNKKDTPDADSPESPPQDENENEMENKDIYSTHDTQAVMLRHHRLREGLRRWMTPQAQELSAELWQKSHNVRSSHDKVCMQPLLTVGRSRDGASNVTHDMSADSEQDDTDYVLTQMQKSRESLARSQKKMIDLDPAKLTSPGIMDQPF